MELTANHNITQVCIVILLQLHKFINGACSILKFVVTLRSETK